MSDDTSTAVNEERFRLAKALHDGLCQDLMGATMLSQVHAAELAIQQHPLAEQAKKIRTYLTKASEDLATLYKSLEPPK